MNHILLYIAIASNGAYLPGAPAQLGTYATLNSCTVAMKTILANRMAPNAVNKPEVQKIIETTMQYQREYICVKSEVKE